MRNLKCAAVLFIGLSFNLAAQNVGIGTSSFTPDPASMLEVRSTTSGLLIPRMTEAQRTAVSATTNSDYGLLVYQTNNDSGFYYWNGAVWLHMLDEKTGWLTEGNAGTNKSSNFLGTTDDENLVFRTNNLERMVVDSNGNVGIGTTAPDERVHINGSTGNTYLKIEDSQSNTGDEVGILLGTAGVGGFDKTLIAHRETGANATGDLFFALDSAKDAGNADYSDTKMIIKSAGNVGIGTTSPQAKLQVNADATAFDNSWISAGGGAAILDTDAYLSIVSTDDGGSGSGIALAQLDISNATDHENSWGIIRRTNRDGVGNGNLDITYGSNPFVDVNPELVSIDTAGNVGIGTTAPLAQLDVVPPTTYTTGPGETPIARFERGFGGTGSIDFYANSSSQYIYTNDAYSLANTKNLTIGVTPTGDNAEDRDLIFQAGKSGGVFQTRMVIKGNGDVGMGTTSPLGKLHIYKLSDDKAEYIFTESSTGGYTTTFNMDNVGLDFGHNSSIRSLNFLTASEDRMTITGNGGVGVNTTSPSGRFHVNNDEVGSDSSFVVRESGRVGIGTTSPSEKLHVDGNARVIDSLQIGDGIKIAQHLGNTKTWNPGGLNDGEVETTTITVTGAAVGDLVTVGHTDITATGVILSAIVTSANTVTVTLFNKTGALYNASGGTLRVGVWKY